MEKITAINIIFPNKSARQKNDNKNLLKLLAQLKNFKPNFKADLTPKTIFNKSDEFKLPKISFMTPTNERQKWVADDLEFGFNLQKSEKIYKERIMKSKKNKWPTHFISPKELFKKLSGRLVELNHAGLNFSPKHLRNETYRLFKNMLAEKTNLYRYPTGEEWPFIIPSTQEEFIKDIKNKSINRNPKFEIVYSKYHDRPLIQLDIQTNLSKKETLELFPSPYGISFEGLKNFFRTVFVNVDWGNVLLRFDLRFKNKQPDFGYWLIEKGGRIQ